MGERDSLGVETDLEMSRTLIVDTAWWDWYNGPPARGYPELEFPARVKATGTFMV